MSTADEISNIDFTVDQDNLYIEASFTDLKVASIRRLTPVKPDGSPDPDRKTLFVGHTQLMSPAGPVPVQSAIEAKTLTEAFEKFPDAITASVEKLIEAAKEAQRQEASRIVVPGSGPGGSKIQL